MWTIFVQLRYEMSKYVTTCCCYGNLGLCCMINGYVELQAICYPSEFDSFSLFSMLLCLCHRLSFSSFYSAPFVNLVFSGSNVKASVSFSPPPSHCYGERRLLAGDACVIFRVMKSPVVLKLALNHE